MFFAVSNIFANNLNTKYSKQNLKKTKSSSSKLDDSDLFRKNEKVVFINGELLFWAVASGNNEYAFNGMIDEIAIYKQEAQKERR